MWFVVGVVVGDVIVVGLVGVVVVIVWVYCWLS